MDPNFSPELYSTGAWVWENLGKELVSGTLVTLGDHAKKQWGKFKWPLAAKKYQKKMKDLYSTMRMLGVPNPVPVEGIFTDLFILDKPTAFYRYDIETLRREKTPYISYSGIDTRTTAIDLIKNTHKLFILGKPGAGKTTLLKYITLLATNGGINKIPIFVSLNDWSESGLSLMDYIVRQFEICAFPEAILFIKKVVLEKGKAIILFDGLDEVNENNDNRRKIVREMQEFIVMKEIQDATL